MTTALPLGHVGGPVAEQRAEPAEPGPDTLLAARGGLPSLVAGLGDATVDGEAGPAELGERLRRRVEVDGEHGGDELAIGAARPRRASANASSVASAIARPRQPRA